MNTSLFHPASADGRTSMASKQGVSLSINVQSLTNANGADVAPGDGIVPDAISKVYLS